MAIQGASGITWTEQTWNPIRGCSRVNEDCRNCYAERVAMRFSDPGQPYADVVRRITVSGSLNHGQTKATGWNGQVQMVDGHLADPLRWKRPRLVFVNSMSDLFHESLAFEDIDRIVAVMALASRHTFQVLTKRPARMAEYLASRQHGGQVTAAARAMLGQFKLQDAADTWVLDGRRMAPWPLPNVWWGASMGHQKAVDDLGPKLLACRPHAAVLWVSAEPMIERVNLERVLPKLLEGVMFDQALKGVDWVVAGGESGPNARPCHPDWARAVRDDCQAAGVPFHWKQWGEWTEEDTGVSNHQIVARHRHNVIDTAAVRMFKAGKKAAGRLLDGRTWDEWPRGWTPRQTGD